MHASHRPPTSYAPPLRLVCRRVRHRSPPGPTPSVLPPLVPATRLRTPPRLRASTYRASAARAGTRRRMVGHRLRARRLDCPVWKDSRPSHQRATRGAPSRDVVWSPRAPITGQHFTSLRPRACKTCTTIADANPLRYGISASNELARLRSLLDDIDGKRIPPSDVLSWIRHELSVVVESGGSISRTNTCSR